MHSIKKDADVENQILYNIFLVFKKKVVSGLMLAYVEAGEEEIICLK